jgi:hypothetical protein
LNSFRCFSVRLASNVATACLKVFSSKLEAGGGDKAMIRTVLDGIRVSCSVWATLPKVLKLEGE